MIRKVTISFLVVHTVGFAIDIFFAKQAYVNGDWFWFWFWIVCSIMAAGGVVSNLWLLNDKATIKELEDISRR